jgi:lipopolysaccharide/colanic/teichoic acid biosynthesis glycosyltransferase
MVNFDIHYSKNKSLLLDLKIILKTIPAIVSQTKDIQEGKENSKPVLPAAAAEQHQF